MNTAKQIEPIIDYESLIKAEPAIDAIIRNAVADLKKLSKWDSYELAKRRLSYHVGWKARWEALANSEAWDIAIKELAMRLSV